MHITACLNSISVYTCTQTVDALPYWGNDNSENTYIYNWVLYIPFYTLVSWIHGKLAAKDRNKINA